MAEDEPVDTSETPEKERWMDPFIDELRTGKSVTAAALVAGIGRKTVYAHREKNPHFRSAWDDAIEAGSDILEDELLRRAKDGTLRPVYQQGVQCGEVREYSDTLGIFLMKARRPEKYRDNVDVKHSGSIDHVVQLFTADPGEVVLDGDAQTI